MFHYVTRFVSHFWLFEEEALANLRTSLTPIIINIVRQQSAKNQQIQEEIRKRLDRGEWATGVPLPPARELATEHGVSSSTAYRILVRLAEEGVLWQHSKGRFYGADARHLVDTVQPFACMLPRLQLWSLVLQEIMHGVTERSAYYKRGTLLIHNPALILQDNIDSQPRYADAKTQTGILEEFFSTHADSCEGIIFDNVWRDDVLAKFHDRLKRMVVINRRTSLDFVSAVYPDFDRSALLAFAHLHARGFEKVYFISTHDDYYVQQTVAAGLSVAREIGADFDETCIRNPRTAEERQAFVQELKQSNQLVGLFSPDDNWSLRFYADLQAAGVSCPEQVGLLTGIGTKAVRGKEPLSTLVVDFELMGEMAVDCLRADQPKQKTVDVKLEVGATT